MIRTGLDVLRGEGLARFRGQRLGLVTHASALSGPPRAGALEVFSSGAILAAVFGPEHGLTGEAQDLTAVQATSRAFSLYGDTFESLKPTADQLAGLDRLVIDLQDVGSRYYTFQATMLYCMEAAADVGLPVTVLDRPNPVGWLPNIEGPPVRPGFGSFVGVHSIPTVHGMTIGELAKLYRAERVPGVELDVVPCEGYRRRDRWEWVLAPSPNMPTAATALAYPGGCLFEGTNLSEGRGTTRPFESIGFPGVDPRAVAERLNAEGLAGVEFLPVEFRPTFQKHAGRTCGGVFVVPADRSRFQPLRTGLAMLQAFRDLLGDAFQWRTERYEFVDRIPAIDLLFGSDRERLALEAGVPWREIAAAWEPHEAEFAERRQPHLLYPD
jgi:uncharacterized protein YbbC (DUF1343 family)